MEQCPKCENTKISVDYNPAGIQLKFNLAIDGYTKYMRNDSYYQFDQVKKEFLVYKCDTFGYRKAEDCKDNKKGSQ